MSPTDQELKIELRVKTNQKKYNLEQKLKVLEHLGGSRCMVCGYGNPMALCVDHIHNNGAQDRKRNSTYTIRKRILNMSEKEARRDYQILCANCNQIKRQTYLDKRTQQRIDELEVKLGITDFKYEIENGGLRALA